MQCSLKEAGITTSISAGRTCLKAISELETRLVPLSGPNSSGQLNLVGNVNLNFAGNPGGNYQNSASFTGPGSFAVNFNVSQVQTDLDYLNNLSTTLGALAGTSLSVNLNNNQTQTINASSGNIQGGNSVFTVSKWTLGGGSTLTINGDGLGDSVVINFAGNVINNPSFNGAIVLTGGLTPEQVLFNFTGGSNLSGGPTLTVNTNGATEAGTFLDPNGPMTMDNTVLNGHFFGGDSHNDQVVSGAHVMDTIPEPSTYALAVCGFATLVLLRRLKRSPGTR